jgi:hypothetical protein
LSALRRRAGAGVFLEYTGAAARAHLDHPGTRDVGTADTSTAAASSG